MTLRVVWSANSDRSTPTSKVNLLNDDTYRWDCATVIMSSFRQIEQGAVNLFNKESVFGEHSIRATL